MALTKVIGAGVGSLTEDLALSDSDKIKLGAGSDLQLYHDGSHSYIDEVGTGSLYVRASIIRWTNADGSETLGGVDADGGWFLKANNSNALVIDTNGHVTKPLQPAFSAGRSSTLANFATGSMVTINLNNEIYDQNGDFSDPNFTAPVTGKYQLSAIWYMNALDISASYYILRIATSNRSYDHVVDSSARDEDETYSSYNLSVLADMDANDTASIGLFQEGGAAQTDKTGGTYFTGFLVC